MDKSQTARKRVEVIMKVNCGLMTATQAARELNISRKTYYKWEKKGLSALVDSVTDQKSGRQKKESDPVRERLEKRLKQAKKENQILHQRMALKEVLSAIESGSGGRAKKK